MTDRTGKKKVIYVVTDGEFEDYHIVGVYSTRELAERCQRASFADNIQKIPLDRGDYQFYDAGYLYYLVTFMNDKTFVKRFKLGDDGENRTQFLTLFRLNGPEIDVYLYAKDEKYAVKIAADYRDQYIASGQYGLDLAGKEFFHTYGLPDATIPELDRLHIMAGAKPEVNDDRQGK